PRTHSGPDTPSGRTLDDPDRWLQVRLEGLLRSAVPDHQAPGRAKSSLPDGEPGRIIVAAEHGPPDRIADVAEPRVGAEPVGVGESHGRTARRSLGLPPERPASFETDKNFVPPVAHKPNRAIRPGKPLKLSRAS